MMVAHINRAGEIKKGQISSVILFEGLTRVDALEALAGDIVGIAGIPDISIGETITDPEHPVALPVIQIDEPTIKMTFGVNTSPFTGKEGGIHHFTQHQGTPRTRARDRRGSFGRPGQHRSLDSGGPG